MLHTEELVFFSRWLRAPLKVGAILPSGKALGSTLAGQLPCSGKKIVVELGGGTGSLTSALLASGLDPRQLVVIERDADLHSCLHKRFPTSHIVHGDVRDLSEILHAVGITSVGTVVSGLPLLSMSRHLQRSILEQSFRFLDRSGAFLQFTYGLFSPVAPSLLRKLGLLAQRLVRC